MHLRQTTTVGVVIEDRYLRSLVSAALFLDPNVRMVARGGTVGETMAKLGGVDVLVWDAGTPGADLARDAMAVRDAFPTVGLLALLEGQTASSIQQLVRLGFRGFIRRDAPLADVVKAVRQVGNALGAESALRELQAASA